jgi:hypothetical protein
VDAGLRTGDARIGAVEQLRPGQRLPVLTGGG